MAISDRKRRQLNAACRRLKRKKRLEAGLKEVRGWVHADDFESVAKFINALNKTRGVDFEVKGVT